MLAVGNEELAVMPALLPEEACPKCGTLQPVKYGKSLNKTTGEMEENKTLAVISCCNKLYLVGLQGKKL